MQQAGEYSWARHTLESGSGGQEDGHFWRSYVRLAFLRRIFPSAFMFHQQLYRLRRIDTASRSSGWWLLR
ncbi:hypothetical protein ALQ79_200148 [Pseudomonas amygdali pv. lachrymans]|nr:hypothetical protein ALQ79_200148 [Pseudomonas amygdali pv. lachrymans]